jgi:hypothetical protein
MKTLSEEAAGIKGVRVGGEPTDEAENFIVCSECGQAIDMRDLGEVFRHEEPNHEARKAS